MLLVFEIQIPLRLYTSFRFGESPRFHFHFEPQVTPPNYSIVHSRGSTAKQKLVKVRDKRRLPYSPRGYRWLAKRHEVRRHSTSAHRHPCPVCQYVLEQRVILGVITLPNMYKSPKADLTSASFRPFELEPSLDHRLNNMEHSRTTREQRSGMHDDDTGTGGQFDNPISKGSQGKWEHREDNTGGQGGDTFTPQRLGQSGYDENTAGTGPGGIDTQSDRHATSGQYGGPTSQTAGYADPNRNITGGGGRRPEDDDDYGTGVGNTASGVGKPSITSRVKGAAEKMTGKITGDPGKQGRGQEREEGIF